MAYYFVCMVSYLDLFLLIPIGLSIWRGWKNGFVMEIFSALALFVGLYTAVRLSDWMAGTMRNAMGMDGNHVPITAFIIVFALVCVGIFFLGKLITKHVSNGGAERWNQIGGAFFALTKTLLFLSVVFILFNIADAKFGMLSEQQKQKSYLYEPIYHFGLAVIPSFKDSQFYQHLRQDQLAPLIPSGSPVKKPDEQPLPETTKKKKTAQQNQ